MTADPYPQPGDDVPGAPPPLRGRIAPPEPPYEARPRRTGPVLLAALALVAALAAVAWVRRRQSHRRSP